MSVGSGTMFPSGVAITKKRACAVGKQDCHSGSAGCDQAGCKEARHERSWTRRFAVTAMWWASRNKFVAQVLRFGVAGVKNNIIYYFLYVVLSLVGIGHSLAVVIVYAFGLAYSFLISKNFVFKDQGGSNFTFVKYVLVYLFGLSVNLVGLRVLSVGLGVNHFVAQGLLVVFVSAIVFIL